MTEIKCVVNDTKTGKSYTKALTDNTSVSGRKVGDKLTGSVVDLPGYELQIMGGSDIAGFPMRQDLDMNTRKKLLVKKGDVGIRKANRGTIYRKTVSGNTVSDITAQLNLKVIQHGSKSIEDLWGIKKEEKPVEAAPAPAK
ncbi:MAG TPA: S6e family ribosomal protein [Candidatus Nanoarchaeia archaeon]|nr:S6e family ribosomal protein [Candidatus Nanoarchaeia archaeon]